MSEILIIKVDHDDPEGTDLRTLLNAQFAYERSQTLRWRWLSLFACTVALTGWAGHGALPIERSLAPGTFPALMSAVRVLVAVRAALAVTVECWRYRSWTRAMADHGGALHS